MRSSLSLSVVRGFRGWRFGYRQVIYRIGYLRASFKMKDVSSLGCFMEMTFLVISEKFSKLSFIAVRREQRKGLTKRSLKSLKINRIIMSVW